MAGGIFGPQHSIAGGRPLLAYDRNIFGPVRIPGAGMNPFMEAARHGRRGEPVFGPVNPFASSAILAALKSPQPVLDRTLPDKARAYSVNPPPPNTVIDLRMLDAAPHPAIRTAGAESADIMARLANMAFGNIMARLVDNPRSAPINRATVQPPQSAFAPR